MVDIINLPICWLWVLVVIIAIMPGTENLVLGIYLIKGVCNMRIMERIRAVVNRDPEYMQNVDFRDVVETVALLDHYGIRGIDL